MFSAPPSRANARTCVLSWCHVSSSHTSGATGGDHHSHARSSFVEVLLADERVQCRWNRGTAAPWPSMNRAARPSSRRSKVRRVAGAGSGGDDGLGRLPTPVTVTEATGEDDRAERLEVGLARRRRIERIEPPGRFEQQRRRVGSEPEGQASVGRAAAPVARAGSCRAGTARRSRAAPARVRAPPP